MTKTDKVIAITPDPRLRTYMVWGSGINEEYSYLIPLWILRVMLNVKHPGAQILYLPSISR